MKISVEVSMYPLHADYENHVLDFLRFLNHKPEIKVITNGISTQIFGDCGAVMNTLKDGIKEVFNGEKKAVFNFKVLQGQLDNFNEELLAS